MSVTPWRVRQWRIVTLLEILEHNAEAFCRLSSVLGQAIFIYRLGNPNEDTLHGLVGSLGELQREIERLEMTSVNRHIERIKSDMFDRHLYPTERSIEQLYDRLRDALADRFFLAIPPETAPLYQQPEPLFGKGVDDAFPNSAEDISEAGKCLALGRATASVFHLMRAMEAAIRRLCTKLQIHNTERDWGKLLSDISEKIEAMPKGDKRNRWSETHTHLYHVKQAWRNDTMHPKQTYTTEEAKRIFDAVNVFMSALSVRVSEPDA